MRYRNGAVVAGGLVAGDVSTARSYRVDIRTGRVTPLAQLPVAVHDAAGARLRGHVMVVGGGNATEQGTIQRLAGSGRWRVVGQLPAPRSDLAALTVRGQLVAIGGYDGVTSPDAVLASTNARQFTSVARLPVPVRYPAVVVHRGAIWVFGGEVDGQLTDAVQRIQLGTWRTRVVGRLPHPLGHAAAMVVAGRILVAGGRTSSDSVTAQMWWWDSRGRASRRAGRLPYPLADAGVVRARGGGYLLGGETPQLTDRVVRVTAR